MKETILYYEQTPELLTKVEAMKEKLVASAMKELGLSRNELTIRDIRAADLDSSLNAFAWTPSGTDTYYSWIDDKTVGNLKFLGIYGYYDGTWAAAGGITSIKITVAGKTVAELPVQCISSAQDKVVYFDPIFADQNTNITIAGYPMGDNTIAIQGVFGIVVEKKGLTID